MVEPNRQFYDTAITSDHTSLHSAEISKKVGKCILDVFDFEDAVVLDFACGTGIISQILSPYCKSIIGVDVSQRAIDEYNRDVGNQGISTDEMSAVCIDLQDGSAEATRFIEEHLGSFDVVICSQAYHHIADIDSVTKILTSLLIEDGELVVVDLLKNADSLHLKQAASSVEIVAHKGGFEIEQIRSAYEAAGLDDIDIDIAFEVVKGKRKLEMFLATGVKPS